jgi:hypothetical protein
MPAKRYCQYIVKLTDEERQSLLELRSRGEVRTRTMKRTQTLPKADKRVELDVVEDISHETVRQVLKKMT